MKFGEIIVAVRFDGDAGFVFSFPFPSYRENAFGKM